jgi:hypothetical protein
LQTLSVGVVAVVLMCHPTKAVAQSSTNGGLRGLSGVEILVEGLDEEAARPCNVSKDALDAAVRLPLANSQLRVLAKASPYVYVNVTVMRVNGGCAATYKVSVRRWSTEFLDYVVVWNRGGMLSGPAYDFGVRTSSGVEELTKMLIAAWLQANSEQ